MARIFLSHSSANNAEAIALRDWLVAEGWSDLFLDLDPDRGIAAGERWERALFTGIGHIAAGTADATAAGAIGGKGGARNLRRTLVAVKGDTLHCDKSSAVTHDPLCLMVSSRNVPTEGGTRKGQQG